ncbi:hypothetical protein CA603_49270 [Paraburkholderia hospita]|nr:hypothetical protein CA603_49270 [Paraburkholderia hospita]
MQIEQRDAAPSFKGTDSVGWLRFPNRYECVQCGYGVTFTTAALGAAGAYRWQGVRVSKLRGQFVGVFDDVSESFCDGDPDRFVLDFHCPRCAIATGIGFEQYEFHMAAYMYRPLLVWTANM